MKTYTYHILFNWYVGNPAYKRSHNLTIHTDYDETETSQYLVFWADLYAQARAEIISKFPGKYSAHDIHVLNVQRGERIENFMEVKKCA